MGETAVLRRRPRRAFEEAVVAKKREEDLELTEWDIEKLLGYLRKICHFWSFAFIKVTTLRRAYDKGRYKHVSHEILSLFSNERMKYIEHAYADMIVFFRDPEDHNVVAEAKAFLDKGKEVFVEAWRLYKEHKYQEAARLVIQYFSEGRVRSITEHAMVLRQHIKKRIKKITEEIRKLKPGVDEEVRVLEESKDECIAAERKERESLLVSWRRVLAAIKQADIYAGSMRRREAIASIKAIVAERLIDKIIMLIQQLIEDEEIGLDEGSIDFLGSARVALAQLDQDCKAIAESGDIALLDRVTGAYNDDKKIKPKAITNAVYSVLIDLKHDINKLHAELEQLGVAA